MLTTALLQNVQTVAAVNMTYSGSQALLSMMNNGTLLTGIG